MGSAFFDSLVSGDGSVDRASQDQATRLAATIKSFDAEVVGSASGRKTMPVVVAGSHIGVLGAGFTPEKFGKQPLPYKVTGVYFQPSAEIEPLLAAKVALAVRDRFYDQKLPNDPVRLPVKLLSPASPLTSFAFVMPIGEPNDEYQALQIAYYFQEKLHGKGHEPAIDLRRNANARGSLLDPRISYSRYTDGSIVRDANALLRDYSLCLVMKQLSGERNPVHIPFRAYAQDVLEAVSTFVAALPGSMIGGAVLLAGKDVGRRLANVRQGGVTYVDTPFERAARIDAYLNSRLAPAEYRFV